MRTTTDPMITRLIAWAEARDDVRAVLITSTRAIPGGTVDVLSDYDIVLIVQDVRVRASDVSWFGDFGDVLVAWWDPFDPSGSLDRTGSVVQYADGLKIDFGLWSVEYLRQLVERSVPDDELDAGYRVLLDKDGVSAGLPAPTYRSYLPKAPGKATFEDNVNGFYVGAPYVAKCLLRDEIMPAKWCLDIDMRDTYLRPMLTWWVGCHSEWVAKVGSLGKCLKRHLPPSIWTAWEDSWTGAGIEENWESLFRLMALYRQVGAEVAECLGYPFPIEMADRVEVFTRRMQAGEIGIPDRA